MNMHFKNHVATLTNLGNIKILDFKNPATRDYSIRFLFDEDAYKLHISGDLGDLTATNDSNMVYDRFLSDFADSPEYFKEKINCMSREATFLDEKTAYKELEALIKNHPEYIEMIKEASLLQRSMFDSKEAYEDAAIHDFMYNAMKEFDSSKEGFSGALDIVLPGVSGYAESMGRKSTGIIELYLEAFKLAQKQLKEKERED